MDLPGGFDGGLPPSWIWPIAGVWLTVAGGYLAFELSLQLRRLGRWAHRAAVLTRGKRRMELTPLTASPAERDDGESVRVRGVVETDVPFRSRHARKPAVLARWFVHGRKGEPVDSDYAWQPFSVRLASGERIDVRAGDDPRLVVLTGGHHFEWWVSSMGAWKGGEIRETLIEPGDEIEVLGRLEMVIDPSAARSDPRATPVRRVLAPAAREPMVLSTPERVTRGKGGGSLAAELASRRAALPVPDAG